MKRKREQQLYDLSQRLGIEICALEVGRQLIIPEQRGTGGFVGTARGATWEFMQPALERPTEPLTWTHTHPNMNAFFSTIDVEGAHAYHEMVNNAETDRVIHAVVLGQGNDRHTETIDNAWITKHPKPVPLPRQHPLARWNPEYHQRAGRAPDYTQHRGARWWDHPYDAHGRGTGAGMGDVRYGEYGIWKRTSNGNWRLLSASEEHTFLAEQTTRPPVNAPSRTQLKKIIHKIVQVWGNRELLKTLDKLGYITVIRPHEIGRHR